MNADELALLELDVALGRYSAPGVLEVTRAMLAEQRRAHATEIEELNAENGKEREKREEIIKELEQEIEFVRDEMNVLKDELRERCHGTTEPLAPKRKSSK